jgi:hypothetical protein
MRDVQAQTSEKVTVQYGASFTVMKKTSAADDA